MKVLMKAKAVAILTAFLMVFAMMPLVAFGEETPEEENPVYEEPEEGLESETVAEGAAVNNEEQSFSAKGDTKDVIEYNLWIGTERVTSENLSGEGNTGERGTWMFTPANGDDPATLTLEDFTYEGIGYTSAALSWLDYDKLTILLKGTSTITYSRENWSEFDSREAEGIFSKGSLEIKDDPVSDGVGQLKIHAKGATNNNQSKGISILRSDLIITGGIVNAIAYDSRYFSQGLFIDGGSINVNGGSLTAVGAKCSEGDSSFGIMTIRGKLHIAEEAQEVSATGNTEAISGEVQNAVYGNAWDNLDGTGDPDTIMPVTEPRGLPSKKYKKVVFPGTEHAHSFTYAAGEADKANTITATCTREMGCPDCYDKDTTPIMLALNAPSDVTYDGTPKEARISGYPTTTVKNLAAEPAIKYFKSAGAGSTQTIGEALDDAPVNAGNYVAQMTWGNATASAPFSIAKAPLTITAKDQTYTYNGQTQGEGDPVYDDPDVIAEKVTVKGLRDSDYLANVTLTGSAKDVGEYPIEVTAYRIEDSSGNNVSEKYEVTTVPGKLTIKEGKPKPAAKISGTPLTTMKAGDTSMTIAWQKVSGAEGYDIFFSRCDGKGKTTAKKAQTINGNSTFAWTRSGLTAGVSYKAYVKAYVMKNGSKQYVAASPLMHAYTKGYTKRYTNAKSVKVKKTKVSIKKGKTFKIKAKVKKLKKGKKLMPTKHELKLRYLSTDSSIATVSKKGKIKGVKAGTCYVYAYAHNGVFKKIKVTVK